ncbi:MAG: hypothetical protein WAV38_14590 [Xanthobacteraceae bacterium]
MLAEGPGIESAWLLMRFNRVKRTQAFPPTPVLPRMTRAIARLEVVTIFFDELAILNKRQPQAESMKDVKQPLTEMTGAARP